MSLFIFQDKNSLQGRENSNLYYRFEYGGRAYNILPSDPSDTQKNLEHETL